MSASFCAAGRPLGVVRPTTTEQVQAVLRWATRHRVPVVPQGARTGLSGGANAIDGALIRGVTNNAVEWGHTTLVLESFLQHAGLPSPTTAPSGVG